MSHQHGLGRTARVAASAMIAFATFSTAVQADDAAERLSRHRNLGKAFYENPATQYEAVGEFEKALALAPDSARERVNYGLSLLRAGKEPDGIVELEKAQKQDPSIPHTWFNLGIAYKRASRYPDAIRQLEGMVERVPGDAIAHYNLGVLYKLQGDGPRSLEHLETAARIDPDLAGPHFQLATAYRQAKRTDDAKREMALFREIKQRDADAAVPEDLEWSYYSEIYEVIEPPASAGSPAPLRFAARPLAGATVGSGGSAGVLVVATADGGSDAVVWGPSGIRLVRDGAGSAGGLGSIGAARAVATGDIDNDGQGDLLVLDGDGKPSLWRRDGRGFTRHQAALPSGSYRGATFLDYDHDYDVDLLLLGQRSALLRNEGSAGFTELDDFPFVEGEALAAVRFDLVADMPGNDLLVTYRDRTGVVYRDRLAGRFEAMPLDAVPAGATAAVAHDADHDGWTDLAVAGADGGVLLRNRRDGKGFRARPLPAGVRAPLAWGDLGNRGVNDLVHPGGVVRQAAGKAASTGPDGWPESLSGLGVLDVDADGKLDVVGVDADGQVVVVRNTSAGNHRWLRVGLGGVKNLKLAPGAEVEVKAGATYQKKLYDGTPLHFGLGERAEVDTVRITWPNGLIQNEPLQKADRSVVFEEAQRLSGSCPMIYTWDGEAFRYITDVLGVAPLGVAAGNGEVFPVDHDEYIQIPGDALVPDADGAYEVRIVEELREVAYLDEVRLIAVDHPAEVEIFTSDKFKAPPFPDFRLYGVTEKIHPRAAVDHHGRDVLDRVLALDETYPTGFARDLSGVAEMHHLTLDFGTDAPDDEAILVLSGWVDWADGSTFLGVAQERPEGLLMPQLQVRDAEGRWQTVIEDMGIPAGKPKTIVVELDDVFLSASREIRIVTNLCVYWDEIFLAPATGTPPTVLSPMHATTAGLQFGGFSKVIVHPERTQPERFVYAHRRPWSMWNPTPGRYTRYGAVEPLLETIDDRMVVMGSGDELRLRFDGTGLPALAPGWTRDFLLFVDGWAKDGDPNTAHSQTVGPLPYHGMPGYPYEAPHAFPSDGARNRYREHYQTRPALRLLRPLVEGTAGDPARPAQARPAQARPAEVEPAISVGSPSQP